ncbi:type II toxin-antitoxin system RelE/ParE family toxin [Candidatus Desantisbacteria bacterium]|nr:type II toxin-antitoxin system RelE/ParE family toxin [Candidatus Desantisbacteria bacterium]
MRVHWTNTAIEHLLAIYEYIAKDSPMYAQRMIDKLIRHSEQITIFSLSGRMVPEYEVQDIREVIEKPYRIIYRIKPYQIDVLAVVHGAQLLPPEL